MFVVLLQARAGANHPRFPAGERHSFIGFVQATTHDEAVESVSRKLYQAGWVDHEPRKAGEIEPESVNGKDASIVAAFEAAATNGCGFVLYEKADE